MTTRATIALVTLTLLAFAVSMWFLPPVAAYLAIALVAVGGMGFALRQATRSQRRAERYKNRLDIMMFGMEHSPSAIVFNAANGKITYANSKFTQLLGREGEDLTGHYVGEYRDAGLPEALFTDVAEAIVSGKEWTGELFFADAPPTGRHTLTTCRPIFDDRGELIFVLSLIDDISDQKAFSQRLYMNANYDAVTGLPNRARSIERLEQAIAAAQSRDIGLTLIYLNVDRFKLLNESLGHAQGDRVLYQIAARLRNAVPESSMVGCMGGDKFLVVLPVQRDEEATRTVLSVKKTFEEPLHLDAQELRLTASIGMSTFPDDGDDAPELLRNAESAMYSAKERGGDNFYRYRHEPDNRAATRLALESNLRHAIERDELSLAFQPVISLASNTLKGAEVLLRWHNPELDNPSPDAFIPVAEETGLVVPIGDWVLNRACIEAMNWQRPGREPFVVAVNISARQFEGGHIIDAVEHALAASQLPAHCLELEITERLLMVNNSLTRNTLDQLKERGVRLTLDDFGTGYASLSYLKQYPFDILKIDRSFIMDCQHSEESLSLVRAIVSMAHSLGMEVIAEGVEQLDQRRLLRDLDCDMAQGFLFTPPLETERFITWAEQYTSIQNSQ